jgi:acyl-CoA synthetase (AMP-forming)/AMP-acid ligase II
MPDVPLLNIAARLPTVAKTMPEALAVVEPLGYDRQGKRIYWHFTFRELDEDSDRIAAGLRSIGVTPGTRLALLVRPGIDFISLSFALFKAGAVALLIDPGMGRRNLIRCLAEGRPQGFVAIPMVHAVRTLLRGRFPESRFHVTVGRRWFWGGATLTQFRRRPWTGPEMAPTAADDPAAIIFTTGSTGPPKGVLYRHGNFDAQVDEIRDFYGIQPGEIDLPCFPLFGLFNCAMGVTAVIPDLDPSRPAQVDPAKIIEAVRDWNVTQTFGSPAIWNRVSEYCQLAVGSGQWAVKETGKESGDRSQETAAKRRLPTANCQLPTHSVPSPQSPIPNPQSLTSQRLASHERPLATVRRVLSAGAPVPAHVLERMRACIHPEGEVHTPYGATEALPVASIGDREVLSETANLTRQGAGVCVGRNFPGIEWKIIRIVEGPIRSIADAVELPSGEIGELIVRGPVVTREYVTRVEANVLGKIADGGDCPIFRPSENGTVPLAVPSSDSVWHRMGDSGYLDEQGRFWFCGRVAHRVVTAAGPMFPIRCEAIFNQHPAVYRSALVGVGSPGRRRPVIILEPKAGKMPAAGPETERFLGEVRELGKANPLTAAIDAFLLHPAFPVDIRHNAKIFREKLAAWAAETLLVFPPSGG